MVCPPESPLRGNRFSEFVNLWPNVKLLAKISRSRILNFWSGLGYYSRAKNLLLASKIIHTNYKDKIPDNYEDLISLPGIGDYTAKAILGIAYNKPSNSIFVTGKMWDKLFEIKIFPKK